MTRAPKTVIKPKIQLLIAVCRYSRLLFLSSLKASMKLKKKKPKAQEKYSEKKLSWNEKPNHKIFS